MKNHEFSIIASGLDPHAEDFESRFYEAGCDDAGIGFRRGLIIIDFDRESESIWNALESAIKDVTRAGATVESIEPDILVSLSEMANRAGMSRAAMSLYANGQRQQDFPTPVAKVISDSPLWDWADVASWLYGHDRVSYEAAQEAYAIKRINEMLRTGEINRFPDLDDNEPPLLAAM